MIDLKKIKDLVKLMVSNDLTELDLQSEGERVTLKRCGQEPVVTYTPSLPSAANQSSQDLSQPSPHSENDRDTEADRDDGLVTITSPIVGTFYFAANPDAPPFVNVGDAVTPDTVVCIIEAMKVFNEIRAEVTGTIEKVLVNNGQAVEYGSPLYLVRPA